MNLVEDSVIKLEEAISGTGCDDGAITLRRNPDAVTCQYEQGVCIESCYGGSTGEFVTSEPVETTTRISSLLGAALPTPGMKGAACAILNALVSFLCLVRGVRACPGSNHPACRQELRRILAGKSIFIAGPVPFLEREYASQMTDDPGLADVILIAGEAVLSDMTAELVSRYRTKKEIICLGPSTAGVAGLQQLDRFCPFGTR